MLLKEYLDQTFKHVKFDKKLHMYMQHWLSAFQGKNDDTRTFFGGTLFGTTRVYFTTADMNAMYSLFDIDLTTYVAGMRAVTDIDHTYMVRTEPTNLLLLYIAYRYMTDKKLNNKLAREAAITTLEIYITRQYAILMSDWVQYVFNEEVAKAAYENMSNKYILRQAGSWGNLIRIKAEEFVDSAETKVTERNRYLALRNYNVESLTDSVSAIRGNAASTIKHVYNLNLIANKIGSRVGTDSLTVGPDNVLADVSNDNTKLVDAVGRIFSNNTLIQDQSTRLIGHLFRSLKLPSFIRVLKVIDKKITRSVKINKNTEKLSKDSLLIMLEYLRVNGKDNAPLGERILTLKRYLVSSSAADVNARRILYYELFKELNIHLVERQVNVHIAALQLYMYIIALEATKDL